MEYKIRIENQYVEVSAEVYKEYYRMDRRERYLVERDVEHGVTFYNALDNEDRVGEEILVDTRDNIECLLIEKEEREMLYDALMQLKERDRELIMELYFNEKTERDLADQLGIRHQNIHKRKMRILRDLKDCLKKF